MKNYLLKTHYQTHYLWPWGIWKMWNRPIWFDKKAIQLLFKLLVTKMYIMFEKGSYLSWYCHWNDFTETIVVKFKESADRRWVIQVYICITISFDNLNGLTLLLLWEIAFSGSKNWNIENWGSAIKQLFSS